MMKVSLDSTVPVAVGVVCAVGIDASSGSEILDEAVAEIVARRAYDLEPEAEAARLASRDMLRNGRYKPTGRGKPASEYLLRAATAGEFPRINGPVDVCNVVSLMAMLPVSVWDLDRAGSDRYLVRHGDPGESYVFNATGQAIDLEDLVLGARISDDRPRGEPIVNPVKDSLGTKTGEVTRKVGALVYAPMAGFDDRLEAAVDRFVRLVATCGPAVETGSAILRPGATVEV